MSVLRNLQPLTESEIQQVYEASLVILEKTGVKFADEKALKLFSRNGGRVEYAGSRVHLPPSLVESALRKVSPTFTLYGRGNRLPLQIGRPNVHFANSTYDMWVFDYRTGKREQSTLAHVEKFVRLNEAIENIDIIGGQVVPQDVPLHLQQIKVAEMLLKYATKPFVMNIFNEEEGETILEMAAVVAGGRDALREKPFLMVLLCPDSPLRYEKPISDVLLLAARSGIPVGIGTCPIVGSSAPMTLAGVLVQIVAEALAGVVLTKLANEKLPVLLGTTSFLMAPQGHLLMAAPEGYLISRAFAQICEHLGIPNSFSSTHTDSRLPTLQTGYEKAMGLMLAVASGSPIIQVPAILDDGTTTSFEQVVIESEMAGAARRLLRGIEVTPESLALHVIEDCALDASFLVHDHTVQHLRSELWRPRILYRGTWENLQSEKKTIVENASDSVAELLRDAPKVAVPQHVAEELERLSQR